MNINPKDKTIKALLISGSQFSIPRFQREYSWDKKNYQEFLEDMIKRLFVKSGKLQTDKYFLGTMLFIGDYSNEEDKDQHIHVVDGQQRITTITILFSALSDRFRQLKEEVLSEQIFRYIMTKDDNGDDVRVLESTTHYPYFSFFIQDRMKETKQDTSSEEEKCIKESYEHLYKMLDEGRLRASLIKHLGWSKEIEKLAYIDILKAIRDQVLQTTFVSISTPDKAKANMIFEILNAKGKKLSHVDLIKNKIFEIVEKKGAADYAEVKWDNIKKNLVSRDEKVGLATFYRHFWISTYKKSASTKLYDDFIKVIIPKTEERYKNFLEEMEESSLYYIKIMFPKREDYENRKEYFWLVQSLGILMNYFNIVQVRIALLALFKLKANDKISSHVLKKTILYLENFHFAYIVIFSGRASKLETIYAKFALEVRKCTDRTSVHDIVKTKLIEPLDKLFPDFEQFSNRFVQLTYSKKNNPDNIKTKYLINKLNCFYDEAEIFSDSGSIEHIRSEVEGDQSLSIGNLILLEQKHNQDAGNLCYKEKKKFYMKSSYKWINEFIVSHDEWEENKIEERAKKMAEDYYTNIFGKEINEHDKNEK